MATQEPATADQQSASTRRSLQDYTHVHACMTHELWQSVLSERPLSERCEPFFRHLYELGLRNPSEATYGMITALLSLSGQPANATAFQAYCSLQTVKSNWRSFCSRQERGNPGLFHQTGFPVLRAVPHVQVQAMFNVPLVACPVAPADVQRVVATVPLRKPRSAAWAVSSAAQAAEPPNTAALLGALAGLFTGMFRQPEAEPLQLLTLNRPAPAVPGLSGVPAVASAAEQPAAAAAPQLLAGETTSRHLLALQDEMPSVEAVAAEEPSGIALSGPPDTATVAQLPPAQAQPSFEEMRSDLAQALVDRDASKAPNKTMKRPAVVKRPAAADSTAPACKRPATAKCCKRPAAAIGSVCLPELKEGDTCKTFASRAYHAAKNQAVRKHGDEHRAKEAAREAHRQAVTYFNGM